ncbi:MAG TPA: hypothetical protein VGL07_17850 [Buttiauxella sp.]|jgi:hypothetical protein
MKLSERAAQVAIENGGFLQAGDATFNINTGDVIEVTPRIGLEVLDIDKRPMFDAPLNMVMANCRQAGDGYVPYYSDVIYETSHQAALAQMLNDAGEGFDPDDLIDWQSLDAWVSVITVRQVTNYANK